MNLDVTDRKILAKLDADSRASASQIAKGINASKETVNYRIKRLVDEGHIRRFQSILNFARLGYSYSRIFLRFHKNTPAADREMLTYLRKNRHCAEVNLHEGGYDMSLLLLSRDVRRIHDMLSKFRERFGMYIRWKDAHTVLWQARHLQQYLFGAWHEAITLDLCDTTEARIDDLDKHLLRKLSLDARAPATSLAEQLQSQPKTLAYRMKRLQREGIIAAHSIWPDTELLGLEHYFLCISLSKPSRLAEAETFFGDASACVVTERLFGQYDLLVQLLVPNPDEMKRLYSLFRERFAEDCTASDLLLTTASIPAGWSPFQ